jgi:hypothetical protein
MPDSSPLLAGHDAKEDAEVRRVYEYMNLISENQLVIKGQAGVC